MPESDPDLSRRDLLTAGAAVGGVILLSQVAEGQPQQPRLDALALPFSQYQQLAQVGGQVTARLPDGTDLLVVRVANDRVIAVGSKCTHNGCAVAYDPNTQRIVCPCHQSQFDLNGQPVAGPARRPLPAFRCDWAVAVLYPKPEQRPAR